MVYAILYTSTPRHVKKYLGAGVGLTIHGGLSLSQGLVAIVTEVECTGPGFIIGNLTEGQI